LKVFGQLNLLTNNKFKLKLSNVTFLDFDIFLF